MFRQCLHTEHCLVASRIAVFAHLYKTESALINNLRWSKRYIDCKSVIVYVVRRCDSVWLQSPEMEVERRHKIEVCIMQYIYSLNSLQYGPIRHSSPNFCVNGKCRKCEKPCHAVTWNIVYCCNFTFVIMTSNNGWHVQIITIIILIILIIQNLYGVIMPLGGCRGAIWFNYGLIAHKNLKF